MPMKRPIRRVLLLPVLAVLAVAGVGYVLRAPACDPRETRFGHYCRASPDRFEGHERRSATLRLADGRRLAYDLFLPTRAGAVVTDERLPTLFSYTPYLRALRVVRDGQVADAEMLRARLGPLSRLVLRLRASFVRDGDLLDQPTLVPWLGAMLRQGYAVIAVEMPGTGASEGSPAIDFERASREAAEILDWIAERPWSNGSIGMYGQSFTAMTAVAAASSGNPHLRAVFAMSVGFDPFESVAYPGGVFNKGFNDMYVRITADLDGLAVPVERGEAGEAELDRILLKRGDATFSEAARVGFRSTPWRDGRAVDAVAVWEQGLALHRMVDAVSRSGVAVYLGTGWRDIFTRDAFLYFENLRGPRRLVVRPVHHGPIGRDGRDLAIGDEARRFFDHWLRGIDAGLEAEPPIHYFVTDRGEGQGWRSASSWPPDGGALTFHLGVDSAGAGTLALDPPPEASGLGRATDPTVSTGTDTRWNGVLGDAAYGPMNAADEKSLVFSTAPLPQDAEIVGHPVVALRLVARAEDFDVFVRLEEVDSDGRSHYLSEGQLRASRRARSAAPYSNFGLPYHSHRVADAALLEKGTRALLELDLLPIAHRIIAGNRIRLTIAGADADNFVSLTAPGTPLEIRTGGDAGSTLELPLRWEVER